MKTLFEPQERALAKFAKYAQSSKYATIDSSMVGTGKTVVACALARALDLPVGVVCTKSTICSWERELADAGCRVEFVTNYERIRTGNTPWLKKAGKKIMRWAVPPDTLLIFDEVHKAKGAFTQNAQLVISAVMQGYRMHLMSATACQDPTEMRAIGYALGMHSLNSTTATHYNFFSWLAKNGCKKDYWEQWRLKDERALVALRQQIYGHNGGGYRLTIADFPDSFKRNEIHVLPVAVSADPYDKERISEEAANAYVDAGETPVEDEEELFIVRLLRARQAAERAKIGHLTELAENFIEEGVAPVIFCNFRDTASEIATKLKCGVIEGGQSAAARQELIDAFQSGRANALVCNIEAGGTGLSLHHCTAEARPRVSLICPSFNAKSFVQVLGRIHRNGALSDAAQYVVVAADTVEESVVETTKRKVAQMLKLHGADNENFDANVLDISGDSGM